MEWGGILFKLFFNWILTSFVIRPILASWRSHLSTRSNQVMPLILSVLTLSILASGVGLVGCSHGQKIENLNDPLVGIKNIVRDSLPGGTREVSANGREYKSHYVTLDGRRYDRFESSNERAYAQILILGTERPYDLLIQVIIEKREGPPGSFQFYQSGYSEGFAKRIADQIQNSIVKRRGNHNVFDQIRPF